MKLFASSIILFSLLLFCSCESSADEQGSGGDGTLLVNLDISVALSDISDVQTRAADADYADTANENEKMHTLRVVIVRPNWTVEENRLIDFRDAVTLAHTVAKPFRVVGNERKQIYLFVNEHTEAASENPAVSSRKLVDADFGQIEVGSLFPTSIEKLKIRLDGDTEQLDGPLPMSERHEYLVSEKPNQSCRLFVTRAAVKFTFCVINESSDSITLNGLNIEKMAREEWYMPRARYGMDEVTGQQKITEYEVPAGVGYYTYKMNLSSDGGVTVESGGERLLAPVYLLEGKYIDEPDSEGRNYSVEMTVNNVTRRHYLPELEALPRNTHVVVNIRCDADAEVTCTVDVIPYSEKILEPEFGL